MQCGVRAGNPEQGEMASPLGRDRQVEIAYEADQGLACMFILTEFLAR